MSATSASIAAISGWSNFITNVFSTDASIGVDVSSVMQLLSEIEEVGDRKSVV
jgi:hypothetical protein